MKKTLFNVFLFTAGAAVGSLVTWKVVKTKYERIMQEEIDSVKETWRSLGQAESRDNVASENDTNEDEDEPEPCEDEVEEDPVMIDYAILASRYNRCSDERAQIDEKGGGAAGVVDTIAPYVIPPEDFADGNYDHELHCVTYYSDGILADDWWEILDIDDTIGEESLNHIGDYSEDVVHVRNEHLKRDYEVTRDPRKYSEVVAKHPLNRRHAD